VSNEALIRSVKQLSDIAKDNTHREFLMLQAEKNAIHQAQEQKDQGKRDLRSLKA
jgi:hypothetical protein